MTNSAITLEKKSIDVKSTQPKAEPGPAASAKPGDFVLEKQIVVGDVVRWEERANCLNLLNGRITLAWKRRIEADVFASTATRFG